MKIENKKILAIIPAYNEEESLGDVIDSLRFETSYIDIVVINDGSTDKTKEIAQSKDVIVINLPFNMGIGVAVQTGYKYAWRENYNIAVQVDGDGQHDPKFINELLKPLLINSADMVIGSRYLEKIGFQSTIIRRIGIRYFCFLIGLLSKSRITDPTSGFRAVNRKVIEFFSKYYPSDYPEPESALAALRKGFRIKEIPVEMNPRKGGLSSINWIKAGYYMIKVTLALLFDELQALR